MSLSESWKSWNLQTKPLQSAAGFTLQLHRHRIQLISGNINEQENTKARVALWVLPAEAEGSPCLAAGAEQGAEQGSAGWPVSCAETVAGSAGMQVGSLLERYST